MLASLWGARSLSAATLVAVSHGEGVDVWGRYEVFTSPIRHLYSVGAPGPPLDISEEEETPRATRH